MGKLTMYENIEATGRRFLGSDKNKTCFEHFFHSENSHTVDYLFKARLQDRINNSLIE
jgi:hypothetical protein